MSTQRYIGLDWGTSSLRAYWFDAQGKVLEERGADWGMMNLPVPPAGQADTRDARFRHAFWQLTGDWLADPATRRRVMACGMVGSAQGWREAAYLPLPLTIAAVAGAVTEVDAGQGVTVAIAPGLLEHGALPNVIRGEETQIAGVPALLQDAGVAMSGRWLLGLPGTHSKWVRVADGVIEHFDTFMTGEVFALLQQHSVLGRTLSAQPLAPESEQAEQAFLLGVDNARSSDGARGLLATIFSSRTLGLTGALSGEQQREYLSGLLLGHEISGLLAGMPAAWQRSRIALIGRPGLCARYQLALARFGREAMVLSETAGIRGLWAWIQTDEQRAVDHGSRTERKPS